MVRPCLSQVPHENMLQLKYVPGLVIPAIKTSLCRHFSRRAYFTNCPPTCLLQRLSSARSCIYCRLRSIQGGHDYQGVTGLRSGPAVFKPWPVPDVRPVISTTLRARLKAVFSAFSDESGLHLAKKKPRHTAGHYLWPQGGAYLS